MTPIGGPGPNLYIAAELQDHQFKLAGGTGGLKVSWQVTGVRQDAWATTNPIVVEDDKSAARQGRYLHPEAHGQPGDRSIAAAYHTEAAQHLARIQPPSEPGTASS